MNSPASYSPAQSMRSMIADNTLLLMALSRFGIKLGFADKSVEQVCREQGIDLPTFLTMANYISNRPYDPAEINLQQLIQYLKRAHNFFLDFQLPMIRRKLIEAIDVTGTDSIGFLILKFFDEYAAEVRNHMEVENDHIFPYVEQLLEGNITEGTSIETYARGHIHIEPKLKELKDIIVKYYPGKGNDLLMSALYDIITSEQDLGSHCRAEDDLFIPAVRALEQKIEREARENPRNGSAGGVASDSDDCAESADSTSTDAEKINTLSEREKEIVCLIAKGLTNKEIAARLFLSVHTVATHRRNITAKLQIHSPAGLTIFAIVNGLLPLSEIPRSAIQ